MTSGRGASQRRALPRARTPQRLRRLACLVLLAGAVLPAPVATAGSSGGVGIRLLEAPGDRRDDPRAYTYIVDHVRPGTTIERRFEVSNSTSRALDVDLYAGAADITGGEFVGAAPDVQSELTQWTTLSRSAVRLPAGGAARPSVRIAVPSDASQGEYYGVVWASVVSRGDGGVRVVNRVGIRVYLSVGPGGEPASDFEVSTLTASRTGEGRPVVTAEVHNTGGPALDLSGELLLAEGPGALSAGPFPVEIGTTLGPGDVVPVTVVLDRALPDGPWQAGLTVRSGLLERYVEAEITFPAPGRAGPPVDVAGPWWRGWAVVLGAGIAPAVVLALLLARAARGRPRRRLESAVPR